MRDAGDVLQRLARGTARDERLEGVDGVGSERIAADGRGLHAAAALVSYVREEELGVDVGIGHPRFGEDADGVGESGADGDGGWPGCGMRHGPSSLRSRMSLDDAAGLALALVS
ncbi:hypothetical protein GCM10022219_24220 [Microbacterium oryzae]